MDPDYVFILIIVAIVSVTIVLKHYFRAKARGAQFTGDNGITRAELQPLIEQVDRLEKRMRVMEKIVTDKGDRLARELSELED